MCISRKRDARKEKEKETGEGELGGKGVNIYHQNKMHLRLVNSSLCLGKFTDNSGERNVAFR
jgi:hypothetical protein